MMNETLHDKERIARELGYHSYADAPRPVQNNIDGSAADGVRVVDDAWETLFEDLADAVSED